MKKIFHLPAVLVFLGLSVGDAAANEIIDAAKKGDFAAVQRLVNEGADVNAKDGQGYTALHWSVAEAHLEVSELLLQNKADVHARTSNGETPLHIAATSGRPKTTQLLLDKGAELHAGDYREETPLFKAASAGRPETVRVLLERGADIHAGGYSQTPLHGALEAGHIAVAKQLIEKGARIDMQAFHPAMRNGDYELLEYFMSKGASIDYAALADYVAHGGIELNTKLLDFFFNKDKQAKAKAGALLTATTRIGDVEGTRALLARGVDVNARDIYGNIALHWAAQNGNTELAKLLLDRGADIKAKSDWGNTPLHRAVPWNHTEVVKLLLERGADVNLQNEVQITPLHMAAARNQAEIVGLLLTKGADLKIKSDEGLTAGEIARNSGFEELAKVLGAGPPPGQSGSAVSGPLYPEHAASAVEPTTRSSPGLTIKAPIQAENGNVVPFTVEINPPVRAGDQLTVMVNDEVACTVRTQGGVSLSAFSARFRVARSGQFRAVVNRSDGGQAVSSANINVTVGATFPEQGSDSTVYKTRVRNDEFLVLFNNDMARRGYIRNVLFGLRDGAVEVSATPLVSQHPLFMIRTPNSLDHVQVSTALHRP